MMGHHSWLSPTRLTRALDGGVDPFQNRAILGYTQTTPGCDEGIVTPWHSNAKPHDDRAIRWRLLRHATQPEYGVKCSPRVLRISWETGPSVAPIITILLLKVTSASPFLYTKCAPCVALDRLDIGRQPLLKTPALYIERTKMTAVRGKE